MLNMQRGGKKLKKHPLKRLPPPILSQLCHQAEMDSSIAVADEKRQMLRQWRRGAGSAADFLRHRHNLSQCTCGKAWIGLRRARNLGFDPGVPPKKKVGHVAHQSA